MDIKDQKIIEKNSMHPQKGQRIDLSKKSLSILDYQWLANIMKKSSYLEMIVLPKLAKDNIREILQILNKTTKENSTLTKINIDLSLPKNNMSVDSLLQYQQIKSRIIRNKNRVFAIHGGGNIGIGLMADVATNSMFKYRIIATSNNRFKRDLINTAKKLWLQHGSLINNTTCVDGVTMISRETSDIIELYTKANIAAICLTPDVMRSVARDIAQGLIKRYEIDGAGLKILILMNLPNCSTFVRQKITDEVLAITGNELYTEKVLSLVQFVPTVIDRIVTPIKIENVKLQLKTQLINLNKASNTLQKYPNIYDIFDANKAFYYQVDNIIANPDKLRKAVNVFGLQFSLFNAEKKFSIYVPESFPEAKRFPLMKLTKNLNQIETIKNKYINGPHAMLAWVGALMDYDTIAMAIKDPFILTFVTKLMEQEIGPILRVEYPETSTEELQYLQQVFIKRCASMEDSVTRVGRNPLGKLNAGNRIRGSIELAQKHRLEINIPCLEFGIASGIFYGITQKDPTNKECQKIREIYQQNNKSFAAVLCYSGPMPSGNYIGFDSNKDKALVNRILSKISWLKEFHKNKKNHTNQQLH